MVASKKLKAVLVEWHDILDGGGEWQDDDGKLAPVTVRTCGFMLSKGPKHIVLVRDYFDDEGKRTLGGRLAIPTGCIVKITQLG
jgi:hypothetical protein